MAQTSPASGNPLLEAALNETRKQLGGKRYEKVIKAGTLANLQEEIVKLSQKYATKTVPRIFNRINDFVQTLNSFVGAINNIAAGVPLGPLVWGILRLILTVDGSSFLVV
jgi:hypothetical protein